MKFYTDVLARSLRRLGFEEGLKATVEIVRLEVGVNWL